MTQLVIKENSTGEKYIYLLHCTYSHNVSNGHTLLIANKETGKIKQITLDDLMKDYTFIKIK